MVPESVEACRYRLRRVIKEEIEVLREICATRIVDAFSNKAVEKVGDRLQAALDIKGNYD